MKRSRPGFTLVELLVVIFIIGILSALVLSAVQRSRSTARQTHCLSNLSQVGKAILFYENRSGRLPAKGYWWAESREDVLPFALRSWVVEILPDLDQQPLADRWDPRVRYHPDPEKNPNLAIARTPIETLACPMDPTLLWGEPNLSYVVNGGFVIEQRSPQFSPTTTHGVFGTWIDLNADGRTSEEGEAYPPQVVYTDERIARQAGIFFNEYDVQGFGRDGGSIPLSGIRDGLAQTILVSENYRVGVFPDAPYTGWANPDGPTPAFIVSGYICRKLTIGPGQDGYMHFCDTGGVNYDNANNHAEPFANEAINGRGYDSSRSTPWLASGHRGGVNIFLADGSARFLSERVAGNVYAALVTPDGGNLIAPLRQAPLDAAAF